MNILITFYSSRKKYHWTEENVLNQTLFHPATARLLFSYWIQGKAEKDYDYLQYECTMGFRHICN